MAKRSLNWYEFRDDPAWLEKQILNIFDYGDKMDTKLNLHLLNQYAETHPLEHTNELTLEEYFARHLMRCATEPTSMSIEQILHLFAAEQKDRNEWERVSDDSSKSILRFCIRILESIKINREIRTTAAHDILHLKSRQQLRLNWQFTIYHASNKNDLSLLQYDETNMCWITIAGQQVEIDWMFYLQQELKQKQKTFKYYFNFPLQNRPFQHPLISEMNPNRAQFKRLQIQNMFPEVLYDDIQQQKEELLDIFGASKLYNNLPSDLQILLESFL
jgi:hypothetical protein